MKTMLIVHNEIPTINHDQRTFYLIKELSKTFKITLLTIPYTEYKENGSYELKKYCDIIFIPKTAEYYIRNKKFKRYAYKIKSKYNEFGRFIKIISKLSYDHFYQIFNLSNELKKLLKNGHFDYIQIEHFYLGSVLNHIKTNSRKILDFHNVHSSMKNNFLEKILVMKNEKNLSTKYDMTICCSKIDKERLRKRGYKNLLVISNGVDTNYFKPSYNKSKKSISLLFIGQLHYKPNSEGLKYFFERIFPLMDSIIKINVIGDYDKNTFKEESKLKNVKFYGYVKNIRPYFKNSVFICPLLDGGGIRVKLLTAFAAGCPVVSTSKGAEGIEYSNNKNILIADRPESFAKKINELLSNKKLYESIKKNARKLAENKYDWKKIAAIFSKNLEKLN